MNLIDRLFGIGSAESVREGDSSPVSSSYRCVEIKSNSEILCPAARMLNGKRFLPEEIPELPLPGCTAEHCSCSYELHDDRRRYPRGEGPTEDLNASLLRRDEMG